MRNRRVALGLLLVGLGSLFVLHAPAAPEAAPTGKVALSDIHYDDLGKLVRANKGKVVVVDFWGEY